MATAHYNLSNYFVDRWLTILENEYGGSFKSQNAAKTIQSTFRKYMLRKKFLKLREINNKKKWHPVALPDTSLDARNPDIADILDQETFDNEYILNSILQDHLIDGQAGTSECGLPKTENESMIDQFYDFVVSYRNAQVKSSVDTSLDNEAAHSGDRKSSQVEEDIIKPILVDSLQKSSSPVFFLNSVIEDSSGNSRKMLYKIGLNLFNKNPDNGIRYLTDYGFVAKRPYSIAKFFQTRSGISKQMIGEYLGDINKLLNSQVLIQFTNRIDVSNLQIDIALRKFQSFFRMPGEAQKIERLVEVFSLHYCKSNINIISQFKRTDTVFLLAFAIIMLNTDLHNPNIKPKKKMKLEDFIKNLDGIDGGDNVDKNLLIHLYDNILNEQLRPAVDHTSLVMKIENLIVDKKPRLVLPFRRLVCYCRLYEIKDLGRREKLGLHQREIFLFNDSLLILKLHNRKKNLAYKFKQFILLAGFQIIVFNNNYYKYGVMIKPQICDSPMVSFNARNGSDQMNFIDDLREVIAESNKMESLRIKEELDKHHMKRVNLEVIHAKNLECGKSKNLTVPKFFRLSDFETGKIIKYVSHSLEDVYIESTQCKDYNPH